MKRKSRSELNKTPHHGDAAPRILNLSARIVPGGKNPPYPLDRMLGGPHSPGLDEVAKRKVPAGNRTPVTQFVS